MPTVLQFRRGTTAQNNAFTGSAGEVSIDTDLDTFRIHDGSTAGGFEITQNTATQTLTNKTLTSPVINTATAGTSFTLLSQGELRLGDSDSSNYVGFKSPSTVGTNLIFTLPSSDGSAGQALVTDASGTLSFAAAGATITSDTSTNTDFLLYFASTTSGALTAVKQDSGLIYNPSTGLLTSAGFVGALTGTASAATLAADATKLATTRAIQVSGAVTGTANFDGSAAINIVTTATSDPTITLAGDLTGSVTLTNLASGTLTATIAANSVALGTDTTGNYVAAGAVSGTGLSGSVSSEGGTFTVTSNATSANTGSTIVARDASGNFAAGTITATATSAQYADLAEKYSTDTDLAPGTVVTVCVHEGHDVEAASIGDIAIGVVSTDPAVMMNSAAEGQYIGLKGRLPVRVIGAVAKGQVVFVDNNGCASTSINGGSMVGIALESNTDTAEKLVECVLKV